MRHLSDTIARLSAFRKMTTFESELVSDRLANLPPFGSNPGNLGAKTYTPVGLPANAPLVVVLHGCTQTAAAYDFGSGWSQLADREGFALLFPEQKRENNPNLCFNWFVPEDVYRDSGEALSIRQMVEAACAAAKCDRRRVYITGLSAGGAMAAAMLAAYPEVFDGGAIIAGLPYGCAVTVPEAFDRMRGHAMPAPERLQALLRRDANETGRWPKLSVWHGDADSTVVAANATAIVDQWRDVHGVSLLPERRDMGNGNVRDVYLSGDGVERIELHIVPGMAHGTPLATASGLGNAGPYMLDAGISSTLHIAQFWGIAPLGKTMASVRHAAPEQEAPSATLTGELILPGAIMRDEAADTRAAFAPAHGVKRIIEDALRAAGLMR